MKKILWFLGLLLGFWVILSPITLADDCVGFWCANGVSDIQGIAGTDTAKNYGDSSLLDTIKTFINWMLGMLATIALVIVLWAGFMMVTAAGDDAKYNKGMSILKQAGMGLIIIWLAWMIVSVVFWLIGAMT